MTSEWRDKSFLFRLYLNYFGFLSVNISRAVHLFSLLLFLPLLPLITLTILLINNYIINCFVEQIFFNLLIIWFKSLLLVHPADSVYQKIFKKFYLLKKKRYQSRLLFMALKMITQVTILDTKRWPVCKENTVTCMQLFLYSQGHACFWL